MWGDAKYTLKGNQQNKRHGSDKPYKHAVEKKKEVQRLLQIHLILMSKITTHKNATNMLNSVMVGIA